LHAHVGTDDVPLFWRKESTALHSFLDDWVEQKSDETARRAFVTGPPGTGKSCSVLHWIMLQAEKGKNCLWLHNQPLGGHAVLGIQDKKAFSLAQADVSKNGMERDLELKQLLAQKWDIVVYDGLTQVQVTDGLAIPLELDRKIGECRFIYVGSDRLWIKMEAKHGLEFKMESCKYPKPLTSCVYPD
jgi:hypothetical protein